MSVFTEQRRGEAHRTGHIAGGSAWRNTDNTDGFGAWLVHYTKGNVLINRVPQPISVLLCMFLQQLLPCSMPQTHRPSRPFGSKQTHHRAKQGTQPVCRGSPAPLPLRTPGSSSCHPQRAHRNRLCTNQAPCRNTPLARKPSQGPRLDRGDRSQQEG